MPPASLKHCILATLIGLCALCALPAPAALAMGEKPASYMVGFRTIGGAAEENELTSIAVWYPSNRAHRSEYFTTVGPWRIRADKNASPATGLFPVILFSHDMTRHSLANHDLCSALAEAGFVVIAPTHYGDNQAGAGALFTGAIYYHRPRQLRDALAAISSIPELSAIMNMQRIGVLGVGGGAATALQLSGVDIAPQAYWGYCDAPGAEEAFCGKWAASRLTRLEEDAAELRSRHGDAAFTPLLPNIRAVGLLTPGGLFLMNQNDLGRIPLPVAAVFAQNDEVFTPPVDSADLMRLFPAPLYNSVNTTVLKDVDHYSLSAPCPEQLLQTLPALCGSAEPGVRKKAARDRNSYFISFFRAGLGVPLIPQSQEQP